MTLRPHLSHWVAYLRANPWTMVGLCVLLHLSIVIPLAALLSIFIDEAYTLNTTGSTFSYALHQALHFEQQPPLYFLIMNVWRRINESIFFGRIFSILCTCGAIVVTARCGRRILPDIHPGWVAITIALHPFSVWAALEIRLYALLLLLTSLMLLFFWDGYWDTQKSSKTRALFCVCAAAALYTQYYTGFLLLAFGGVLLVLGRWAALRRYMLTLVCVGILFAPMLMVLPDQWESHPMQAVRLSFNMLLHMGSVLGGFIVPRLGFNLAATIVTTFAIGMFLAIVTALNYRRIRDNHALVWATFVFYSAALSLVVTQVSPDLVKERHACSAVIFVILGAFSCLSLLRPGRARHRLIYVYTSLFLIASISNMLWEYRYMAKPWDARRMAEYVMDHEKPGQAIVLFTPELALPFSYYYHGINPMVPLPYAEDFKKYDMQEFALHNWQEIEDALQARGANRKEIWLLRFTSRSDYMGVDFNMNLLEEYIDRNYSMISSQQFYLAKARLLRRASVANGERAR